MSEWSGARGGARRGSFCILMLIGGTTPLIPSLPPQYVAMCPAGGLIGDFRVAP